jgi:periplasmic divalent cation tolerance protein
MTDGLCEVVITAPDRDWLANICRELIEERLASSAHLIHPVISVYRWKGTVMEATEARAMLRSRVELVDAIVAYVVPRHPYETPNVTALPILNGFARYLDWVRESTEEMNP